MDNMFLAYILSVIINVAFFVIISLLLKSVLLFVDPQLNIKRKIEWKEAGTWIGLCEFILILFFVILNEYTAIAVIFAAKELVRIEDIKKNPTYFLLGTLLNVTLSILSALSFKTFIIPLLYH
jgi:hypothetical protein